MTLLYTLTLWLEWLTNPHCFYHIYSHVCWLFSFNKLFMRLHDTSTSSLFIFLWWPWSLVVASYTFSDISYSDGMLSVMSTHCVSHVFLSKLKITYIIHHALLYLLCVFLFFTWTVHYTSLSSHLCFKLFCANLLLHTFQYRVFLHLLYVGNMVIHVGIDGIWIDVK